MIILAPTAPVLFLYDVTDTEGEPLTEPSLPQSSQSKVSLREILKKTQTNCELHGICLRYTTSKNSESDTVVRLTAATRKRYRHLDLDSKASYLILLNEQASMSDNYKNLACGLGQIFCGHYGIDAGAWWPERAALPAETEEIEAQSVAGLVIGRQGSADSSKVLSNLFDSSTRDMPPFSLNAVIQAAGYIEEMGRRQWSTPRKKSRYRT